MKSFLCLSLLALAACGVKHTPIDYGKTTVSDLIAAKGEPIEDKAVPVEDSKMLIYPKNEKFQVKDNIVHYGFKEPSGDERTLLYWKHKFRDCDTTTRQISKHQGHQLPEYELNCRAQGITVIYTENSEFVSRIVEHEKK